MRSDSPEVRLELVGGALDGLVIKLPAGTEVPPGCGCCGTWCSPQLADVYGNQDWVCPRCGRTEGPRTRNWGPRGRVYGV